ncbi:MAG: hypothetical protein J7M26_07240, partial [Armatimonadetes bacterium]|nr:hypothetical protein [Armatimonadota bacterium]
MTGLALLAVLTSALPAAAAGADAVVFWASSPVQPGQIAMVCGYFARPRELTAEVAREPDTGRKASVPAAAVPSFPSSARRAKVVYASDTAVMFEVPDRGGLGVYRVRLGRAGARRPAAEVWLNAPEVWWLLGNAGRDIASQDLVSPDATVYATPGGWVRIVGRCLVLPGGKPRVILRGKEKGGRVRTFALEVREVGSRERLVLDGRAEGAAKARQGSRPGALKVSSWTLVARLPKNMPVGFEGQVLVYNGYGSAACWAASGGYKVRVVPRTPEPPQLYLFRTAAAPGPDQRHPFPETPVTYIDVQHFGADGDDQRQDTPHLPPPPN